MLTLSPYRTPVTVYSNARYYCVFCLCVCVCVDLMCVAAGRQLSVESIKTESIVFPQGSTLPFLVF